MAFQPTWFYGIAVLLTLFVPPSLADTEVGRLWPQKINYYRVFTEYRDIVQIPKGAPYEAVFPADSLKDAKELRVYYHPLSDVFAITAYLGVRKLGDDEIHQYPPDTRLMWNPVTIPLKGKPSADLRLTLDCHPQASRPAIITFPRVARFRSESRPAVILISLDTLRTDHLLIYGSARNTSPNLAEFAKQAFVFDAATAPPPSNVPSHVEMMTGLDSHKAVAADPSLWSPVLPGMPTMSSILVDAGYVAEAITGGPPASIKYFPYFDAVYEFTPQKTRNEDLEYNTSILMDWIQAHKDEAFFLFFQTNAIRSAGEGQYDVAIARVDRVLGELFAELSRQKIFDESLIIITSDDGPEVGQIPLLIKLPGQKIGKTQTRISSPARLVDLLPTVLDVLKLPAPDHLDGSSLLAGMNELKREGRHHSKAKNR